MDKKVTAPFEMASGSHAKAGIVKYTAFANNFIIINNLIKK